MGMTCNIVFGLDVLGSHWPLIAWGLAIFTLWTLLGMLVLFFYRCHDNGDDT
jgi:hypothetical protein